MRKPLLARITKLGYTGLLKPIFFKLDPEKVHERALHSGVSLGNNETARKLVSKVFGKRYPSLRRTVDGVKYPSPIGLAAGFDKNGELLNILPSIGFGFMEVGSVTKRSYLGNTGKRLVRAPHEKGIFVNYGLKSEGAESVAERLSQYRKQELSEPFPVGVSVAPTNDGRCTDPTLMVEEYVWGVKHFEKLANYLTLNLSCPNTSCGQPFLEAKNLRMLLDALPEVSIPLYLKLSPDKDDSHIVELLSIASDYPVVKGVVLSNLTKDRTKLKDAEKYTNVQGGLSGKTLFPRTLSLITHIKKQFGDRFTLIACGGITTAAEIYELEKVGADLVQLVTAIIYNGPSSITLISADLDQLYRLQGPPTRQ